MNIETANRLLQYRKKSGYSQEDLAEKIGVSRQAVSKWERAEASPDTENLILLARLYGVTVDELLTGVCDFEQPEPEAVGAAESGEPCPEKDSVSFKNGIHVDAKNGDKVHIGLNGIHVKDSKGAQVDIDSSGIHVENVPEEDVNIHTDENGKIIIDKKEPKSLWYKFPYPIIALFVFAIWGVFGGWAISWIVFLTIPLYYTLVDAIIKKNPKHFAYPVLTAMIYLILGICFNNWHPSWLIFLTIPLYYFVCEFISEIIKRNKNQ